jgi:hypothetical protein
MPLCRWVRIVMPAAFVRLHVGNSRPVVPEFRSEPPEIMTSPTKWTFIESQPEFRIRTRLAPRFVDDDAVERPRIRMAWMVDPRTVFSSTFAPAPTGRRRCRRPCRQRSNLGPIGCSKSRPLVRGF